MEPIRKHAVRSTVLAAAVVALSILPWGSFEPQQAGFMLGTGWMEAPDFDLAPGSMTVNGWNGSLSVMGVRADHSMIFLAAVALAVLAWLRATSVWNTPRLLSIAIAAYGVLHLSVIAWMLMISDNSSLAPGLLLTLVTFVGLLRMHLAPSEAMGWSAQPTPDSTSASQPLS